MSLLIEAHLDVLFRRSSEGRLIATRDPSPQPAPRAFLGRSGEGNVWATQMDLDREARAELERLLAEEPCFVGEKDSGPRCRARVLELLDPIRSEYRGPTYVLGDSLSRDDRAREVTVGGYSEWREVFGSVEKVFPWLSREFEAVVPVVVAFEQGEPAAICHSARGRTAIAAEAGVETVERFRARGLATAAVACWARAVQRSGRLALYSTSWENQASQAVARRLSARLYGEDWYVA